MIKQHVQTTYMYVMCMCVYVYVYVYIYICIYICTYIYIYIYLRTCTHTCIYIYIYTCVYIYIYTHTRNIHTHIWIQHISKHIRLLNKSVRGYHGSRCYCYSIMFILLWLLVLNNIIGSRYNIRYIVGSQ